MKIAVCFKALPDFDQVVDADWDSFSLSASLDYVKRVFGCFDESALETALRLRSAWEDSGEKAECSAITAAPLPSFLCKTLFAAGFDRVVDLGVPSPEFRPRYIASVLGNFMGPAAYDLILAGRQAGYADTGAVPLFLAEFLGIPVLTGVEELGPCGGGIEVKRANDSGRELLRVRLPLLAVLGNSPVSALRAVSLRARMAASGREAERPPAAGGGGAELGGGSPDSRGVLRFSREERRKICRFLPAGAGLAQSLAGLRAEYLGGWEG